MNGFKKTVLAATAAMVLGLAANAQAFLIDDFSVSQNEIEDDQNGLGNGVSASVALNGIGTDLVGATRTISADCFAGCIDNIAHTSAAVGGGTFRHAQDPDVSGITMVDWAGFTNVDLGTEGFNVIIDIVSCDLCDDTNTDPTVTLDVFGGGGQSSAGIVLNGLGQVIFSSGALLGNADFEDVDRFKITTDGTGVYDLDLQIDLVEGNIVPEPGTILLFGSGLAGLGFWRYRKSQA